MHFIIHRQCWREYKKIEQTEKELAVEKAIDAAKDAEK